MTNKTPISKGKYALWFLTLLSEKSENRIVIKRKDLHAEYLEYCKSCEINERDVMQKITFYKAVELMGITKQRIGNDFNYLFNKEDLVTEQYAKQHLFFTDSNELRSKHYERPIETARRIVMEIREQMEKLEKITNAKEAHKIAKKCIGLLNGSNDGKSYLMDNKVSDEEEEKQRQLSRDVFAGKISVEEAKKISEEGGVLVDE